MVFREDSGVVKCQCGLSVWVKGVNRQCEPSLVLGDGWSHDLNNEVGGT